MHSVGGTTLSDREHGEDRPLALLSPWVVKQRIIHFLTVIGCEKSLKENLQSLCGRALNWWEKTFLSSLNHWVKKKNKIEPRNMQDSWNKCCCLLVEYFVSESQAAAGAAGRHKAMLTSTDGSPEAPGNPGNPGSSCGQAHASINPEIQPRPWCYNPRERVSWSANISRRVRCAAFSSVAGLRHLQSTYCQSR